MIVLTSRYAKKREPPLGWVWRTSNNTNDQQEHVGGNVCLFSALNSHHAANSLILDHDGGTHMGTDSVQKNRGSQGPRSSESASFALLSRNRLQPIYVP